MLTFCVCDCYERACWRSVSAIRVWGPEGCLSLWWIRDVSAKLQRKIAWSFDFSFLDQIINAFISTLAELASADLKILQELRDTDYKEARRRGVAEKQRTFLAPRMFSKRICAVCTCSFTLHWYQYSFAVDTSQLLCRRVLCKFVFWHRYRQTDRTSILGGFTWSNRETGDVLTTGWQPKFLG
jgi:hypothetical protein